MATLLVFWNVSSLQPIFTNHLVVFGRLHSVQIQIRLNPSTVLVLRVNLTSQRSAAYLGP